MAVLKLYGSLISTNSMRVMACLLEKELEFQLVPVDLAAGENKEQTFLSINPFGQVPAFEDGDLKLFESRAITKYIGHEYADKGTDLLVKDSKKMAILGLWMEVEAHQFDQPASKLAWELAYKPMFGMTTDDAVAAELEAELSKVLDVYEARLSQSKYLGGDTFTLADLHHIPNVHFLVSTRAKELFTSRPHVSAWCDDILGRPAWKKVLDMQKKNKA